MSSESDNRSAVIQFLDSFLQERNIKWMLGIGMLILLGSSLMLVTTHWDDYTPPWKYAVLIGYTAVMFLAGELSDRRLGLRRTAAVLRSLTVLLLPLTFLSLRWIQPEGIHWLADLIAHAGLVGLLGVNLAFALFAARRIFAHFLRGPQPTFLAAYMTLCLAGAILPGLPGEWWPVTGVLIWAAFAVGTVKVNRHIFWLTEAHRLPRIFGFFPIALLSAQFMTLFAVNLAPHVPLQWMGLACALVAAPVLLTADAVARVFQQRTGDFVRPFPWSVGLPMITGLVLCAGGICLAATGWPRPFALTPTAAIVAGMMALTARRTRHAEFAWAMLAGILLAYNFSPVFFREAARAVVQYGATAVHEQTLPYAFYGLTYLPLLCGLMVAGRGAAKRGQDLFARPICHFSVGLAAVLLLASFSHAKAVFPVNLVMTAVFTVQAFVFRERRLIVGGILAWIAAAIGFMPFATGVLNVYVPADTSFAVVTAAAALLLAPGRRLDKMARSLPFGEWSSPRLTQAADNLCRVASLLASLAVGAVWLVRFGLDPTGAASWVSGGLLSTLLIVQTLVWLSPAVGEAALVFAALYGIVQAVALEMTVPAMATVGALILLILWLLAPTLSRDAKGRISRTFARPFYRVSLNGLTLLLLFYCLPRLAIATVTGGTEIAWTACVLTVVWAFDAAKRVPSGLLATLGCLGVLAVVSAAVTTLTGPRIEHSWIPAAWAAVAVIAAPAAVRLRRRLEAATGQRNDLNGDPALGPSLRALAEPVNVSVLVVSTLVAAVSLVVFTTPFRVAGGLAALGLLLVGVLLEKPSIRRSNNIAARQRGADCQSALFLAGWRPAPRCSFIGTGHIRRFVMVLLTWQLASLVIQVFAPDVEWLLEITWARYAACALPMAALAATSLLFWEFVRRRDDQPGAKLVDPHRDLLRLLLGISLVASFQLHTVGLSLIEVILALAAFAAVVFLELRTACRAQDVRRVWSAELLAVVAVVYFWLLGVILFGHGVSMFAVLASGIVLWICGRLASRRPRAAIMTGPFAFTAMALPLLTVGIGIVRHFAVAQSQWMGANSLALLLAAGFYFWRGLEDRDKRLTVLSAVVLNVALTLLWRELRWSDPQFFMIPLGISVLWLVELLKTEIPSRVHDPLRYLGALVILVSPTFQIVGGSWLHILSLMVASVGVTLVSIGLRVRALMYTGSAFLLADLVAMVVRGSVDRPTVLWMAGILLGAAVIALAAFCENHREVLLSRMRRLAAELESWQ